MTAAAPPPPPSAQPAQPPALARMVALDLVTRFHLRLTDPRDSRLGPLLGQYEMGAAGWTGTVATFVGFYTPPADARMAGPDLAARCAAASQWAHDRLAIQGAERADVLIVALGPIQGSITPPPLDNGVSVGAIAVDPRTAEVTTILAGPRTLPTANDLRARARLLLQGQAAPTLAAVDLAERQAVAGGYAAPARAQLSTTPYATYGLIASFIAVFIIEKLLLSGSSGVGLYDLGAFAVAPGVPFDWWRLVSSAFLHDPSGLAGIDFLSLHLVFNCIATYLVGRLVEQLYGRLVLLSTFVIAAVGGNLLWILFSASGPNAVTPVSVGASGGILGLLGLLFMLGRMQGKGVPVGVANAMRQYAISYFVAVLIFGFFISGSGLGNVNQLAHVGGALAGAGMGAVVPPLQRIGGRDLSRVEVVVLIAVIGAAAFALGLAAANVVSALGR